MNVAEYHAQELEKLKNLWKADMWPALFQAVQYCHCAEITLPEWAATEVLQMIQDRFHDGSARGVNGKYGSIKGGFQMNYAHFLRWNALKRAMFNNGVAELPKGSGRPRRGAITKLALKKEAKTYLKGRLARTGGIDTIEESFWLVESSKKAGEFRFAFDELYYPLE